MPPVLPAPGTPGPAPGERTIEITINYGLNIPLKADDEKGQATALESARRALYEIAAGECRVLMSTIASSCRLERLNVQSTVQRHNPGMALGMIHVAGNGAYRITLK